MSKSLRLAALAAYGAVVLDAMMFIIALLASNNPVAVHIVLTLSIAFQLLLFPVVALVPSESWARASGYGSNVIHTVANVMLLNGVGASTVFALQLGANVLAALWIASVSWKAGGALRVVGLLLMLLLFLPSLVTPWLSRLLLLPELVLFPVWLILIGRLLMRSAKLARMVAGIDWS